VAKKKGQAAFGNGSKKNNRGNKNKLLSKVNALINFILSSDFLKVHSILRVLLHQTKLLKKGNYPN